MKAVGVLFVLLAVAMAAVPVANNCTADGNFIVLPNGTQLDMKCFWSSRASLALALPLCVVGVLLALSKRRESQRYLAITGGVLAGVGALIPTVFIGVCGMSANCAQVMRPTLILTGILGVTLGAVGVALSVRAPDAEPSS